MIVTVQFNIFRALQVLGQVLAALHAHGFVARAMQNESGNADGRQHVAVMRLLQGSGCPVEEKLAYGAREMRILLSERKTTSIPLYS